MRRKKLVCSPDVDKVDMKRTLEQAIKTNGLETEIRNIVYHLLRASNKCDNKNPVTCVSDLLVKSISQFPSKWNQNVVAIFFCKNFEYFRSIDIFSREM